MSDSTPTLSLDVAGMAESARLDAEMKTDVAQMRAAAQEYEDSALACDTPELRRYWRRRNLRAIALRDGADRYAALIAEVASLRERVARGERERETLAAENKALRHAGGLLSNIAYTLAQRVGLVDEARLTLDAARKRWDAALCQFPPSEPRDQ